MSFKILTNKCMLTYNFYMQLSQVDNSYATHRNDSKVELSASIRVKLFLIIMDHAVFSKCDLNFIGVSFPVKFK